MKTDNMFMEKILALSSFFKRIIVLSGTKNKMNVIKQDNILLNKVQYSHFFTFYIKFFLTLFRIVDNAERQNTIIEIENPSIIGILAWLVGKVMKVRTHLTILGFPEQCKTPVGSWLAPLTYATLLRLSQEVLTTNPVLAKRLQKLGAKRVQIVPNMVNLSLFRAKKERKHRQRVILYVGRLSPEKGVDYLIKAYAKVKQKESDVVLWIVGSGPQIEYLKKLASSLNMKDVFFWGRQPRVKIPEFMQDAEIFVLPSFYEGFGNVLLEAMACELPIIGTNSGAIPWVIQDAGLLVPPGDIDALAEKIIYLLRNPEIREELALKGRKRVEDRFDFKNWGKEMYKKITGRGID
jgi:glycosyltransferase involved in cell wall biosynthesis